MRTLIGLLFCTGFATAQEATVAEAKASVVGIQARRMIEMRGRQFPVNMRQIGIVVSDKGLILTTSLGENPENVRVFLPGTTEAVDAEVVDSDASFTLLRVEDQRLKPIVFKQDWKPANGEKLTWIGLLAGSAGKWTPVASEARVDAIIKDDASSTPIVYSDPPFRGPVSTLCALVLSKDGDAVGVVTMRQTQNARGGGRRGFRTQGLPVVRPAAAFAQYLAGDIVKRGVMGVTVEALAPKVAEAMGLKGKRGVVVTQVTPGSGAAAAGIEAQDILTTVGGTEVGDPAGLQKALRGKGPGTEVDVTLMRMSDTGPETKTVKVKLTAREGTDKSKRFRARRFGFTAEPLTADVRRAQQLPADLGGVHVRRIVPGGPASMGRPRGLRRRDVILKVGNAPVTDIKSLQEALKTVQNGKPVALFVRNGKDTRFVEITPEAAN